MLNVLRDANADLSKLLTLLIDGMLGYFGAHYTVNDREMFFRFNAGLGI